MFYKKRYKIRIYYFKPDSAMSVVNNLELSAKEFSGALANKEETEKLFSYPRFLDLKAQIIKLSETDKERSLKVVALIANHDGIPGKETGLSAGSNNHQLNEYLSKIEKLNYHKPGHEVNLQATENMNFEASEIDKQNETETPARKAELMRQISQQLSLVSGQVTDAEIRGHWLTDGITRLEGKGTTAEVYKEYAYTLEELFQKLTANKVSVTQATTEFHNLLRVNLNKTYNATNTEAGISGNIAFTLEQVKQLSETGFQIVLSKMLGDELGAFGAVLYNNTTDIIQSATAIAKEKDLNPLDPAVLKEAIQKTYNEQFIENLQSPIQQWAIRKFGKSLPPQISRSLACGLTSAFAEVSGQVLDGALNGKNPLDILSNIKIDQVFVSLLLGLGTGKLAGKIEGTSANEVLKHLSDASLDGTQGVFGKLYADLKEGKINLSNPEYIKEIISTFVQEFGAESVSATAGRYGGVKHFEEGLQKIDPVLKKQVEIAKKIGYYSFVDTLETAKQTHPDQIALLVEENKQFVAKSWLTLLDDALGSGNIDYRLTPLLKTVAKFDTILPGQSKAVFQVLQETFEAKINPYREGIAKMLRLTIESSPTKFLETVKILDSIKPGLSAEIIENSYESFARSLSGSLILNPTKFLETVKILHSIKPGLSAEIILSYFNIPSNVLSFALVSSPTQFIETVKTLESLKPGLSAEIILRDINKYSESLGMILKNDATQFIETVKTLESLKPGLSAEIIRAQPAKLAKRFFEIYKSNYSVQTKIEISDIFSKSIPGFENFLFKLAELGDNKIPAVNAILDSAISAALETKNPPQTLNKIVSIFELENVPSFVKRLMVFKYLYPSKVLNELKIDSPTYRSSKSETGNRIYNIAFRDLAKISINSGEPSMLKLAKLIQDVQSFDLDKISKDSSGSPSSEKLDNILTQLATIQSQTLRGQRFEKNTSTFNIEEFRGLAIPDKIAFLKKLIGNSQSGLIKEFENVYLKPLGIEKVSDIPNIYNQKLENANTRNIENSKIGLDDGDYLIKAMDSRNIEAILNNGILSREFLGNTEVKSDSTPLDTDFLKSDGKLLASDLQKNSDYGNLTLGIKNRSQFNFDQQTDNKSYSQWGNQHEAFISGVVDKQRHVGIRTGIESLEIDFLILKSPSQNQLDALAYNLAKKGLYIPIYDENKKLIFTLLDYQESRKIFEGTQFNNQNIVVQNDDVNLPPKYSKELLKVKEDRFDPQSQEKIIQHQNFILQKVSSVINEQKIKIRNENNFDIYGAEIIDTGSTGRGTSKADGVDFDFAVVLDATTFESKRAQLLESFNKSFKSLGGGIDNIQLNGNTLRLFGVKIGGDSIDIDISVMSKVTADSLVSSDMAVKEKINNIASTSGIEVSERVKQQIVLAKTIMSKFNCYKKTYAGESEPSGIGGIGVENWILSNSGSFFKACKQIHDIAIVNGNQLSLVPFKERYKLFDAGTNLRFIDGSFHKQHNNFIENLNEKGYQNLLKMVSDVTGA